MIFFANTIETIKRDKRSTTHTIIIQTMMGNRRQPEMCTSTNLLKWQSNQKQNKCFIKIMKLIKNNFSHYCKNVLRL